METHNGIKITVLPPMLEEEKVYTKPREEDIGSILGDILDEEQLDGFRILNYETINEELDQNEN